MGRRRFLMRAYALLLIVSCLAVGLPGAARAQASTGSPLVRLAGQVTALDGPAGNPTGFTLQTDNRWMDMRIAPDAMFTARSAEAEVEGLTVGDYALVSARRLKGVWTAFRVVFDVRPIPQRVSVTGTILRVSLDGRHFSMRLDNGMVRSVTIPPLTRFRVDGQPMDGPLTLSKGELVQVLMRSSPRGWVAIEINLKTVGSPS